MPNHSNITPNNCNDSDNVQFFFIFQDNVREWLIKFGLEGYWPKFKENSYTEPNLLADLKFMDKNTLRQTFQISKEGHTKKLMKAIKYLQYPSSGKMVLLSFFVYRNNKCFIPQAVIYVNVLYYMLLHTVKDCYLS